jgi:hypothetical protein
VTYATQEAALARVRVLRRDGVWTGIIPAGEGWRLLYDPDLNGATL